MSKATGETHRWAQDELARFRCLDCGRGTHFPNTVNLTCAEVQKRYPDLRELTSGFVGIQRRVCPVCEGRGYVDEREP